MRAVVDSGVFLAALNHQDPMRSAAADILSNPQARLSAPEAVYVEVMNYLRRKPTRRSTCEAMQALRRDTDGPILWIETEGAALLDAERLYFQHFEAGLSMTDAVVLATARAQGASVASFDRGFRGLVPMVP
jgi:predicted nucleic acid-binding protein